MASNPPFELEDQTDEDFFDKLVDDNDDDVISKNVKFIKADDVFDGNESDEGKAFSNLSVGEISRGNSGSELAGDEVSDDNPSVEAREEHIVDGEANSSSLSSDLPFLENGQVSNNGVAIFEGNSDLELRRENSSSSNGAVKEVQWSAFTESAMPGIRGVGSYDDFFTDLGEGNTGSIQTEVKDVPVNGTSKNAIMESSFTHIVSQGATGASIEQPAVKEDTYSIDYWERLYPGWKYDPNTGQWYQLYGNDGTATSDVQSSQVYYAQQMAQSVSNQISTTENVSGWNYMLHQNGNYQYPAHMIFDPNYPGWYYDTIAQQWLSLEAFHASIQSTDSTRNQQAENGFLPSAGHPHSSSLGTANYGQQSPGSEGLKDNLANYGQQGANAHFGLVNRSTASSSVSQSWKSSGDFNTYTNQMSNSIPSDSTGAMSTSEKAVQSKDNNYSNWASGANNFPADKDFQLFNHAQEVQQVGPPQYPADYYSSQQTNAFVQPLSSNSHHGSFSPSDGRSSASRPPHALVAFGFGGKLLVMRDDNCGGFSTFRSKNIEERFLNVYNLMEVVSLNNGPSRADIEAHTYFHSLCHQSFPGPLVGNVGSKELNKWVDERIASCESLGMNNSKGQSSKLLLSLLKIACQHYGKLRSFGGDTGLKENDNPESAVAKLFASSKGYDGQFGGSHAISRCLMTLPSEAFMQTTATEVQNLLISGRKMEALQRAQEGQFWGFALILSRELGEQFYADTVKQMAVSQLVIGSPLRTLCLLIAKKPEEVFSNSIVSSGNVFGAVPTSPKPVQNAGCSMLDNWEENLAVITSNRTENDHLVIIHLGDCLLKEKNDVAAAHICYLVAEAGFELYSDSARLCLIGADHWNFPRTYASPEAIQRTELFEYAKVLGNSQFILLQLQPYKLIYAHMLAEVGRVTDSLKYCQAVSKSLKSGRSPEADTLKQLLSSLEERIRTYQQSGYVANLAPAKIVGKLLNFIDSTAHRVVGGLPPSGPSPSTTQSTFQGNENQFQTLQASMNLTSSQSTMGMSSLTPSASMEPISQWAIDQSKMTLQNRSISEPDIGRTPKPDQADSSIEATSSSTVGKQSGSTGTSRFGRFNFGAQILQKTVGLVLKPRQGRQAKLGDANKFYYDEKLKRWVEEGAEPAPEESALPPPPTTATFQNGKSDYNLKNALNDGLHAINSSPGSINSTPESSPGLPSTLPSSNQFSGRGRMGVRSRYVDTFNKGGGASTNQFQAPSVPSAKPSSLASGAKFFIPSAALTHDQTLATEAGSSDEVYESGETPSTSKNDPFQNLASAPLGTMQRFPSVGNIPTKGTMENGKSPLPPQSRRAASWSAIQSDMYSRPPTSEMKASPLSFMPSNGQLPGNLHMDRNNSVDDLQEVEL